MVLVIPAAKSPIARNCLEKVPNTDSKPKAKSPTVLISVAFILEAVITILRKSILRDLRLLSNLLRQISDHLYHSIFL